MQEALRSIFRALARFRVQTASETRLHADPTALRGNGTIH